MESTRTGKVVKISFDGTLDIMRYIEGGSKEATSQTFNDDSFCKYSWSDSIDSFSRGWTESEKIKINADAINMMGDFVGSSTEYGVTGDFLDVGTYLSGVPECWGNMVEEPKAMKKARILIDITTNSRTPGRYIENRGSAVIAMIDSLRNSGHYLEITIAIKSRNISYADNISIEIATTFETDNSYSRDALAYYVAHPGMLRRVGMAVMEKYTGKDDLGSYGTAADLDPAGYDIVLEPIHKKGNWSTIESSRKEIESIVKNYEGRQ